MAILEEQRENIYQDLAEVMNDEFYLALDRPYGILLYTQDNSDPEEQKTVADFITTFQLNTIRRIVRAMDIVPADLDVGKLPEDISRAIFGSDSLNPDVVDSMEAVYNYTKSVFKSKYTSGQISLLQLKVCKILISIRKMKIL